MKIAVFVDENERVLSFIASGVVEIYSDDTGEWTCINQIPFDLNQALSIDDLRTRTRMLVSEFEDCNLLVIDSIKGLSKVVLEEYKIGTWRFKGVLFYQLFDSIKEELLRVKAEQSRWVVTPVHVGDTSDAVYEINLASILENNRSLNSRDILVPFLQNTHFRKLTIKCSHTPKWFEQTIELLQLTREITETGDGHVLIVLQPVDFEAGIASRQQVSLSGIHGAGGCSSGCCSSGIC
jgi:Fe-only nitrogenase accessory protein AnfO